MIAGYGSEGKAKELRGTHPLTRVWDLKASCSRISYITILTSFVLPAEESNTPIGPAIPARNRSFLDRMVHNHRAIDSPEFQAALRRAEAIVLQEMAQERQQLLEAYRAAYVPQAPVFDVEMGAEDQSLVLHPFESEHARRHRDYSMFNSTSSNDSFVDASDNDSIEVITRILKQISRDLALRRSSQATESNA